MASNREHFGHGVRLDAVIGPDLECVLYDPQTSGGLLVAVAPGNAERVAAAFVGAGVPAVNIGSVVDAVPGVNVAVA
jgi:selenide,water dikinase